MRFCARRMTVAFASALALLPLLGASAHAQTNPYREIAGWAKAPEGRPWGAMVSVDVDRDGNIWVLERCGANSCIGSKLAPVLKFDPSGKLLTSFGAGLLAFPHGIPTCASRSFRKMGSSSTLGMNAVTLPSDVAVGSGHDFGRPSGIFIDKNDNTARKRWQASERENS